MLLVREWRYSRRSASHPAPNPQSNSNAGTPFAPPKKYALGGLTAASLFALIERPGDRTFLQRGSPPPPPWRLPPGHFFNHGMHPNPPRPHSLAGIMVLGGR